MTANDIIVLDSILNTHKKRWTGTIEDADHFELFSFEQVLKNYDLSDDELEGGKVGASDDGGIDGVFTFVNGTLVEEDSDVANVRKPTIELFLIQAKQSASFTETAIDKVAVTTLQIFNLAEPMNEKLYNSKLVGKVNTFRDIFMKLAPHHPTVQVHIVYATKGDTNEIHPKVRERGSQLEEAIVKSIPGATSSVDYWGARELLEASRLEKTYTLTLRFLENYISRDGYSYIVLARLDDFYRFLTDDGGNLRRYVFESNVRDYQGDVEVNKDIQKTLNSGDSLDFWWLNNGVTVLASKASVAGKVLALDDVQVVNGLQTATEVYKYLSGKDVDSIREERAVLVRIIVTEDTEARDRIIKATNSQTAVPAASLKATDQIQRDIQDFFLHNEWFYDRRKNYYKNLGMPPERIVGIPYLAQAVMAMILREPDSARARPSSLIKREEDYGRVFNPNISLACYLACARAMKVIDAFIHSDTTYPLEEKSNLRFHLATLYVVNVLGAKEYAAGDVEKALKDGPVPETLNKCLELLHGLSHKCAQDNNLTMDKLAKSREFVTWMLDEATRPQNSFSVVG